VKDQTRDRVSPVQHTLLDNLTVWAFDVVYPATSGVSPEKHKVLLKLHAYLKRLEHVMKAYI
jgi:hypothetical protein